VGFGRPFLPLDQQDGHVLARVQRKHRSRELSTAQGTASKVRKALLITLGVVIGTPIHIIALIAISFGSSVSFITLKIDDHFSGPIAVRYSRPAADSATGAPTMSRPAENWSSGTRADSTAVTARMS
jgi:hypothetical protein